VLDDASAAVRDNARLALRNALSHVDSADSRTSDVRPRDSAYSALKQVLENVDDRSALRSIIEPMAEALKASQVKQRRYSAHLVMLFAHKVENQGALTPLVRPLITAHFHDADERLRQSAGLALKRTFGPSPEPKTDDSPSTN